MSIVNTLVVKRYGGRVVVEDRVKGDYLEGTAVTIWLRKYGDETVSSKSSQ